MTSPSIGVTGQASTLTVGNKPALAAVLGIIMIAVNYWHSTQRTVVAALTTQAPKSGTTPAPASSSGALYQRPASTSVGHNPGTLNA